MMIKARKLRCGAVYKRQPNPPIAKKRPLIPKNRDSPAN